MRAEQRHSHFQTTGGESIHVAVIGGQHLLVCGMYVGYSPHVVTNIAVLIATVHVIHTCDYVSILNTICSW